MDPKFELSPFLVLQVIFSSRVSEYDFILLSIFYSASDSLFTG